MADDKEPVEQAVLDLPKKKKKKSKKDVEEVAEKLESTNIEDGALDMTKKKRKKKKEKEVLEEENKEEDTLGAEEEGEEAAPAEDEDLDKPLWVLQNRDCTYEELLERVFETIYKENPELRGEKRKYTIRPPQLVRQGSKKVVWTNFPDICATMKRSEEHVMSFCLAELNTTGSQDSKGQFTIRTRLHSKHIENLLRRYILEYVTCRTCRSPETELSKRNRLYFVTCGQCGSSRSVTTVKQGFVAVIGKRKHMKT